MAKLAVNMDRRVGDIFYRYKMPLLIVKAEGKGSRINAVLLNLDIVGKALGRPSQYISQYFEYKLGTNIRFKERKWVLNGLHTAENLQNLLDGFIQDFVLCTTCENPETYFDSQGKELFQCCRACGQRGRTKNHKLVQFILKNIDQVALGDEKKISRGRKRAEKLLTVESSFEESLHLAKSETDEDDWSLDVVENAVNARRAELCKCVRK